MFGVLYLNRRTGAIQCDYNFPTKAAIYAYLNMLHDGYGRDTWFPYLIIPTRITPDMQDLMTQWINEVKDEWVDKRVSAG